MLSNTTTRLRICHLGKYYPPAPGGIETHVQTLARAQAAMGADVQVACVNHADKAGRDVTWSRRGMTETVEHVENSGVRVCRLGRSAHFAKLDVLPDVRKFFRGLKEQPVDVIHLHTPNPTMLLAVAALRPWAPLVITHHSDVVKQRKLYLAFAPFEKLVYQRAARIISNSPDYAGGSARLQQQEQRVETLPMGVNLEPFLNPNQRALDHASHLRARYGAAGPLWLSVGRCVYYKGYDTAIRALRNVPGMLIIVGQGPYKNHLMKMAGELGVADRIVWCSYASQDELVGAYHAATALWLPSNARSEAFGLVQVEAMASGCPVINMAIPHSGVSWVSKHEETGLTGPVHDAGALARAASRLAAEPKLRQRLGESARRRAISRFSDIKMAERTLSLYTQVVNGSFGKAQTTPVPLPVQVPGPPADPTPFRPQMTSWLNARQRLRKAVADCPAEVSEDAPFEVAGIL